MLAISLLLINDSYAQSFAVITIPKEQAVSPLAMQLPQRPHPGPIITIGAIALPLGVYLFLRELLFTTQVKIRRIHTHQLNRR